MAQSDRQHGIAPGVVSSIEAAMAARRRGPGGAGAADARAAEQLLNAMRIVKAARFNAAERLERKNALSLFTMPIVSLYFVGLSVWQVLYASELNEATNRLVTLVSIMSSMCTLVLSLIESMNDHKMKAYHMQTCALAVTDLYHEFQLVGSADAGLVQEFRRRYNDVVRDCPFNHARVDYLMARAERNVPWQEKAWARLRYGLDVYALYGFCLIAPPLVLILFR